jgi:ribosomal protein S18 acetylase RimI-like enzyme
MLDFVSHAETQAMRDKVLRCLSAFPQGVQLIEDVTTEACLGFILCQIWDFKPTRDTEEFSVGREGRVQHNPSGTELHVSAVSISPDHQGRGLADYLMTTAICNLRDAFPKLRSVVILTDQNARESRHFFAKRRFIAVDQIPGFFARTGGSCRAAIVMRKFFGPADSILPELHLRECANQTDFVLA